MREVYHYRDNRWKAMDSGIKNLTDEITSYPGQELPIQILAANIFVRKYYLIRKFKSSIGMTPHGFCIQNPIRKSLGLQDEEKTSSRIAAEMGFYDKRHFDKACQRICRDIPIRICPFKKEIVQST
jgi:methylphosphotriester-DNA--protein-cysteine methyltransferase